VPVLDAGGSPRQSNGLADLGHGHGCARAGGGGAARAQPRQERQDGRPYHAAAPRSAGGAGHVAGCTRGHGDPRTAHSLLRARGWVVARHRALMVASPLDIADDGRLCGACRAPHLHDACGAPRVAGWGESPGCARTRGPYQSRHDATLHRRRYEGQTHARRAAGTRSRPATAACTRLGRSAPATVCPRRRWRSRPPHRRPSMLPAGTTGLATVLTRPRFIHG
jgi:hypothetical protein